MIAKFISETEIVFPTQDDYLEDGTTLKNPSDWLEYIETAKPLDVSPIKNYTMNYVISSSYAGEKKIVQFWMPYSIEPTGRVAKLNQDVLYFPQKNERDSLGRLICNYCNLPNSRKIADGWLLVEETEKPNDGKTYVEKGRIIEDPDFGQKIKIVWEEEILPEVPFDLSKRKLRLKFRALGKEAELDAYLNSSQSIKDEWTDSVTLRTDNELVVTAMSAFQALLGLSEAQIKALLKECKSDL